MNQTIQTLARSDALVVAETSRRGCIELGVCQQRKPVCVGCTVHVYPQPSAKPLHFAPGTIDYGQHIAQSDRAFFQRLLLAAMCLIALSFVLGLSTGWGQRALAWLLAGV